MIKGEGYYWEWCKVRIAILYQGSGRYMAAPYLWHKPGSEYSVEDTEFCDGK